MGESRGASIYRWVWTILWATLAAVGGALNVAVHGWSTTIGVAVVVAALCAGFHYNRPDRPGRTRHDGLLMIASGSAVVAVSTAGWVTTLGPGALLLPLVGTLSWPGTYAYLASQPRIRVWRGRLDPRTSESFSPQPPTTSAVGLAATVSATPEPAPPPSEPPTLVTTLTDEQLCHAWRASFRTLEDLLVTADTARQAQLITRRQQYLDEFEKRNPHGFARWLASGARPAGDLSRFL